MRFQGPNFLYAAVWIQCILMLLLLQPNDLERVYDVDLNLVCFYKMLRIANSVEPPIRHVQHVQQFIEMTIERL